MTGESCCCIDTYDDGPDPRVERCLAVMRRRVADPASVSGAELQAVAAAGAEETAGRGAQLACLADMLCSEPVGDTER